MTRRQQVTPVATPSSMFVQRLKIWTLFVSMLVLGVGVVWWSLSELIGAVRGLARGAPLLELSAMDVRGLFAGLGVLTLASLCVPIGPAGAPLPRSHRRVAKPRVDWPAMIMGTALILILLCLVAPPFVMIAADGAATRYGYRLCPDPADEHRAPTRWVRAASGGRCPTTWEEARRMLR